MIEHRFVAIEGIDGSGKTYLADRMAEYVVDQSKHWSWRDQISVVRTHEPFDSELDSAICFHHDEYIRDRIIHFSKLIYPTIKNDDAMVICDRYHLSTYAYQDYESVLFTPDYLNNGFWVVGHLVDKVDQRPLRVVSWADPDLYILIDPDLEEAKKRVESRGEAFHAKAEEFMERFRRAALILAGMDMGLATPKILVAHSADEAFEAWKQFEGI